MSRHYLCRAITTVQGPNKDIAALGTVRLYSDRELAAVQNERQIAVDANNPFLVDVLT